ncbi:type II secretion system protein GspN [Geobacter sp. AOG1]|uniref:type II secretion system protein GspN n=1 Tax=Geobacter sp. AOG1 TaxID=1566346 RepID=UPI001CC594F7|nr:type II secretion system protein GspN [Geobacter sp. AOG1]GFE57251.1 type II secretion system protein GspN [Geobacter sp. AOG1]
MKPRRWFYLVVGVPAALFIFLVLTVCFIPARELQGLVVRGLASEGYTFRATSFGKAFPLGLTARAMEIGDERGPLFRADRVTVRLQLLPLFLGDIKVTGRARIGSGQIDGAWSRRSGGGLHASGIRLEDIPFFSTVTGAAAKGVMQVDANLRGSQSTRRGEIKLDVKGAELAGIKIGGTPLPDAGYRQIQGMLRLSGNKANLESFSLEGEGLYVRLRGDFPIISPLAKAPLNLTLELMPKPEFLERQKFVFLLLTKYLTSPGRYEIPVKGMLSRPALP